MKRLLVSATFMVFMTIVHPAHAAGIPVFDATNLAETAKSLLEMKKQLDQMERTYSSMTGNRGIGSGLYDRSLRNHLPPEWQSIYDAASGGGYGGISGSIDDILARESHDTSIDEMQRRIRERERYTAATNKAIGMEGYRGAQARLDQLESLLPQIDAAQDPKAMQEVQARIAVEQAAINNEMTKLQLISMLQDAEQEQMQFEKDETARRILNSENTGMAKVKWH